jgi:hypothetical protein
MTRYLDISAAICRRVRLAVRLSAKFVSNNEQLPYYDIDGHPDCAHG